MRDEEPTTWLDGVPRRLPPKFPEELVESLERAWAALSKAFERARLSAEALDALDERLRRFQTFDALRGFSLLDAWHVDGPISPFVLCVATRLVPEAVGVAKTIVATRECRCVGLFELGRDVGRAVIRPETFRDTVLDLVLRREVDFPESPDFCRRYYVLASPERRLREGLPRELLDHIGSREDLFVEIEGHDMLLFWDRVIDAASVIEAAGFFSRLNDIVAPRRQGPYR